jgi:O-Antigen ligase
MANTAIKIPRAHLIMALCLPMAVLLGYFLAEPMESGSMAVIILVMFVLAVPLMMKWHHPILVLSWNAFITPVFLPGHALIWFPVAAASLVFALLNRAVNPENRFIYVPSIANSLLFLAAVLLITAFATGGIGLRSFGSTRFGGRNYALILMAVAGLFAFSSSRIPPEKAGLYVGMYFLTGLTSIIPNIIYALGPAFYPLFSFFPVGGVVDQARAEYALGPGIFRIGGFALVGQALYCYALARYGVRGALDFTKPLRPFLLITAAGFCAVSGFRSSLILFVLTFCALFYFEGLHKTRLLAAFLALTLLSAVIVLPNAEKLPWVVQRTLSFLPAKIDPIARESADASTEWRISIWKQMMPEIPKYLLIGKGYNLDPNQLFLAAQPNAMRVDLSEAVMMNGDYHSGPLSVIIPFGIFGTVGFVWFLVAAGRFLYQNYRSGDSRLQRINTFILAFFVTKIVFFFAVFGSLYSDLCGFTGLIGLSISLNGRPETAAEPELAEPEQSALEAFS